MQIDIVNHSFCKMYSIWNDYLPNESRLSILDISKITGLPEYISTCMNPTARNRFRYSCRHYTTQLASYNCHLDAIFEINTSAPVRQNKPMREKYTLRPKHSAVKTNECPSHYTRFFGCFRNSDNRLVSYAAINISGDLCAITQIIGHTDFLRDDIMLNLFAAVVEFAISAGTKCILYSRWTDGTDGLRHWKYSVGFRCGTIELKNDL